MKRRSMHCIVRIDVDKPKSQHCWEVKIIRPGNSFHRSFSDSSYGGRGGARSAAMKCRDEELKTRPAKTSFEQAIKPTARNRSGIVGVRRAIQEVRRGRKAWCYDVWTVTGTPVSGGKSKTRSFSINVHGVKKAKALAIAQRKEWEESLRESVERKLKKNRG